MQFERSSQTRKRAVAGLAGTALAIGLAGCFEDKTEYQRPIAVPTDARYLGMSDNDEGRWSAGSGKSFLMHAEDAQFVDCGKSKDVVGLGADVGNTISKEVRVLSNGMAQVTCHGAWQDEFPVERFKSHFSSEHQA
jgi:hypothetical protein